MLEKEKFFVDMLSNTANGLLVLIIAALSRFDNLTTIEIEVIVIYLIILIVLYAISFIIVESWSWRYYE